MLTKMLQSASLGTQRLRKEGIEVVQINLGNRCNQFCSHCHVEGAPSGNKNMDRPTAQKIKESLFRMKVRDIEFTGGAPEMNPNLNSLIGGLSGQGKRLTVRTNLTILEHPEYSFYLGLYKQYGVRIVASLPSPSGELTDRQRGAGVFRSSIHILRKLNGMGYGKNGLCLDLVFNPVDGGLPPDRTRLEQEYREILKKDYSITFNHLITLVNVPIGRFKDFLIREGKYDQYMKRLKENFHPKTIDRVMCRNLIAIDSGGFVYDCDFDLAIGRKIRGYERTRFWEIDFDHFTPEITLEEHCYACTVNQGSH